MRREYRDVTGLDVRIAGFAELGHSGPEELPVLFGQAPPVAGEPLGPLVSHLPSPASSLSRNSSVLSAV